jgi:hypothetical protein
MIAPSTRRPEKIGSGTNGYRVTEGFADDPVMYERHVSALEAGRGRGPLSGAITYGGEIYERAGTSSSASWQRWRHTCMAEGGSQGQPRGARQV